MSSRRRTARKKADSAVIGKLSSFSNNVKPYSIVFVASACGLILEIVAARLLAPEIGVSLYTWTSIIGVVLAGISIGNYLGGRVADRFPSPTSLGIVLLAGSITSLAVLPLVGVVSDVFAPVSIVPRIVLLTATLFLVPSMVLGMVTPLVIKQSLRDLSQTGIVVGKVYAISTAGAIFGVFITGFVLVDWLGTRQTILLVALVLMGMALVFGSLWRITRLSLPALGLFVGVLVFSSFNGAFNSGCVRESNYYCIKVTDDIVDGRYVVKVLQLNNLVHNYVDPEDPTLLVHGYQKVFADLATVIGERDRSFRALFLGGGGYTMPRYLEEVYPQSALEVIEIDPEVTQVAFDYLGLRPNTRISIYHEDARMAVPKRAPGRYDLIIGDVFSDVSVPYHLTTLEFNEQIQELLTEDGIYAVNVIDKLQSGKFLRAFVNTLRETFPYVYLLREDANWENDGRNTHVVAASSRPLSLADVKEASLQAGRGEPVSNYMPQDTVASWLNSRKNILLTDNYAPVDNMLASVYLAGKLTSADTHYNSGVELGAQGRLEDAISEYGKAISLDPGHARAYNNRGGIHIRLGQQQLAIQDYVEAIYIDPQYALAYFNRALAYSAIGEDILAEEDFNRAVELGADAEELRKVLEAQREQ